MKNKKLITFDQLRSEYGITDSRSTLDRKMKQGLFPQCVRTSNGRIAWYAHEIEEYLAKLERGNADNFRARNEG
jgi:predicted DNA-binding transcriptional regulator AlpA